MKIDELVKVYYYTKAIFGSFVIPKSKMELDSQNRIWYKFLSPFELDTIYTAIDLYATKNNFVNIAQIAEFCVKTTAIKDGVVKDADYYLKEISKAVSYSNARENFEKLSDISKQVVGGSYQLAQWANSPLGTFDMTVAPRLLKELNQKLEYITTQKYLKTNQTLLSAGKAKKAVLDDQ